jgi:hypothetical protein
MIQKGQKKKKERTNEIEGIMHAQRDSTNKLSARQTTLMLLNDDKNSFAFVFSCLINMKKRKERDIVRIKAPHK